jgi:hypothetical protein
MADDGYGYDKSDAPAYGSNDSDVEGNQAYADENVDVVEDLTHGFSR